MIRSIIFIALLLGASNVNTQRFEIHDLSRGMPEDIILKTFAHAKHPAQKSSPVMYEAYDGFLNDTGDFLILVSDSRVRLVNFTSKNHTPEANKNYVQSMINTLVDRYGKPAVDSVVLHDANKDVRGMGLENFGHLGPPATIIRVVRWYQGDDKLEVLQREKFYNVSILDNQEGSK